MVEAMEIVPEVTVVRRDDLDAVQPAGVEPVRLSLVRGGLGKAGTGRA